MVFTMHLLAGFSKRDITPSLDRKVYLAGFGRNRVAEGVHDRLWVRCMALSDGKSTLVLAALDLVGLFYEPYTVELRRMFKNMHLVVASTHNHNGPDTLGLWGPNVFTSGVDSNYMDFLIRQIASCVSDALERLKPVHLRVAADDRDELAEMQGDCRPPVVKDPTLNVVQALEDSGRPVFTLIQWSNHPETLGGSNTLITADFPGVVCDRVEKETGGGALYVNGAIGGLLSPLSMEKPLTDPDTGKPVERKSFREMEVLGLKIAEIALNAVEEGETVEEADVKVRFKQVFIPLRNRVFRALAGLGVLKRPLYTCGRLDQRTGRMNIPGFGEVEAALGEDILSEVGVLDIGPVQAVLIPGEIYPELVNGGLTRLPGADYPDALFEPVIRSHMTGRYKLVIGLADDEIGYIIPMCEWDDEPPWLNNSEEPTYGEINSLGYDTASVICESLKELLEEPSQQVEDPRLPS